MTGPVAPAAPSAGPLAAAPPPPPTALISRDHLIRLGQSSKPWTFIPAALQALAAVRSDDGLRLLLAANYARLHLRTGAQEQLALLSPGARAEPNIAALSALLPQLPDDRVSAAERIRLCRANLDALRSRGAPLTFEFSSRVAAWSAQAQCVECFRTGDGNIVRRDGQGAWRRFTDDASIARTLALPPTPPGAYPKPWVLEGLDPPWLFQRLVAANPRRPGGYWPRINVLQADIDEFLDGLSLADLTAELSEDRVHLFLGDRAAADLADDLDRRCATQIYGPTLISSSVRVGVHPPADQVVEAAAGRQLQEENHLLSAVSELYEGRDRAWWSRRFADARAGRDGGGEPLRVLVPTCLYSTFIRHSAADLAGALEAAGCRSRILIEPDDTSILSSVAYLRETLDFQPDLIVLINYTRAHLNIGLPQNVPCVCWIQDAMPHLFDAQVGRRQTDLDFLAGHTHNALFDTFGYSRVRAAAFPVVASADKFHTGSVDAALRKRLECEIALVSHHSEIPESLHQRLCAEAAATPAMVRTFESLYPQVRSLTDQAARSPVLPALRDLALAAARAVLARVPDDRTLAILLNQYAMPLADRLIRHQTLAWAADIAEKRAWRLKIHGRGWETHPRFARYAAGPLEHGEELRASYQCAAVHLHASVHWCYHQRVMECALSGGLPLCRRKEDDLSLLWAYTALAVADRTEPFASKLDGRRTTCYRACDSADAMRLTALLQRLGHPHAASPTVALSAEQLDACRHAWQSLPMDPGAAWLLGDLAESTFADPAGLERAIDRAITLPAWRRNLSEGIAARTRAHFTSESAAMRILDLVADAL